MNWIYFVVSETRKQALKLSRLQRLRKEEQELECKSLRTKDFFILLRRELRLRKGK